MVAQITQPTLALNGVGFALDRSAECLFSAVTLSAWPGEIVGVVGGNGAGKTTLLNIISGLTLPSCGTICLRDGVSMGRSFQGIPTVEGLEFWRYVVGSSRYPAYPLTAFMAILRSFIKEPVAALVSKKDADEMRSLECHVNDLLESVGIAKSFSRSSIDSLSVGLRRAADVLRVLFMTPGLLLLDEPFANLQQSTSRRLAERIVETAAQHGCCIIVVDHDIGLLRSFVSRLFRLQRAGLVEI